MLRYLADEDFDNRILRAFRRTRPSIDWIRVQDVELSGSEDEHVPQFAAENNRLVLSHDVSTMIAAAYRRVVIGEPMPGLIVAPRSMAIGQAVQELVFIAEESIDCEWQGQVIYLPL